MSQVELYSEIAHLLRCEYGDNGDCTSDSFVVGLAMDNSGANSRYGWISMSSMVDMMERAYRLGMERQDCTKIILRDEGEGESEDE